MDLEEIYSFDLIPLYFVLVAFLIGIRDSEVVPANGSNGYEARDLDSKNLKNGKRGRQATGNRNTVVFVPSQDLVIMLDFDDSLDDPAVGSYSSSCL